MCLSCDERNASAVIGDHLGGRDKVVKKWALQEEGGCWCGILLVGNVMHHPHQHVPPTRPILSSHLEEGDQSASLDLGSFSSLISRHSMSTD